MTNERQPPKVPEGGNTIPEFELSDDDILDAMRHIPGYLDISTEDFREVYRIAHRHAMTRVFASVRAGDLMRTGLEPLVADMRLDHAAATLARQRVKGLPVVDASHQVIGMFTETDLLRHLRAETFLELLLRLVANGGSVEHRCQETRVGEAMTAPAASLHPDDGFATIIAAFRTHAGRSMPVVDANGRFLGLLLRKEFIDACHLETLL